MPTLTGTGTSRQPAAADNSDATRPTIQQRIQELIIRNEKAAKRFNSAGVKIMHQRDIHSKRLKEFIDAVITKMKSIEAAATSELDAVNQRHQSRILDVRKMCVERGAALREFFEKVSTGRDTSLDRLGQLQEALALDEQMVDSLSSYELIVSPPLVAFFDVLQNERKAVYVRSSLFPNQVERTIAPPAPVLPSQPPVSAESSAVPPPVVPQAAVPNAAVAPAPPPAYADPPGPSTAGNGGGAHGAKKEKLLKTIANIRERQGLPSLPFAPPAPVLPSQPPVTAESSAVPPPVVPQARTVPPAPLASDIPSQWPPRSCVGVGRGVPVSGSGASVVGETVRGAGSIAAASSASVVNQKTQAAPRSRATVLQALEDYHEKKVVTKPKSMPEKPIPMVDEEVDSHSASTSTYVRLPKTISATEAFVFSNERMKSEGRVSPGPLAFDNGGGVSTAASIVDQSRGLFDDTLDSSFALEDARSRVHSMSMETRPIGVFSAGATGRGRPIARADLRDLLGDDGSPRDVDAEMLTKFGYEKRQEPVERCFSFPIGCTKDNLSGDYIICDTGHHVVKIYDSNAQLTHINYGNFKRPSAVVALDDKTYAIRDDKCIQIFNKKGDVLRTAGEDVSGRAYGLTTDMSGNLVTLELGGRKGQSYILRYDPSSGGLIARIPFDAHMGKTNSKCRFIDCFHDRLYVADLGASVIYCAALEGVNLFEFGSYGKMEPGKFHEPSGITIDANGNLFIGDSRNDRIVICAPNGSYTGVVKFDYPIKRPSGIYLTTDGNLMVMNYVQHYVSLFKLHPSD